MRKLGRVLIFGALAFRSTFLLSEGTREIRAGGYRFINPLLECEPFAESRVKELASFSHKLKKLEANLLKNKKARFISIYFRDLNNGPWFGINEKEYFMPASLMKVPVMIHYFKEAEEDPQILQKLIPYTAADGDQNRRQTFQPEETLTLGEQYTVEELIRRMILYSDNNASNLLYLQAGNLCKDLGYFDADPRKSYQNLTVKQYASFFRMLFNATLLNRKYSEKALTLLSQNSYRRGLAAGIPEGVEFAHKFGEFSLPKDKQLHDCGIVYYPRRPYLLCVMTRGSDWHSLEEILKEISALVYSEVGQQTQKSEAASPRSQ